MRMARHDDVPAKQPAALPVEGDLPSLRGATFWLNSPPLTAEALRGKVVRGRFLDLFLHQLPARAALSKGWYAKYKDHGLVVIGVHAPEFAFEKDPPMCGAPLPT